MRNQRIACKELGRNVDKEIKNDKEQVKTVQWTWNIAFLALYAFTPPQ